MLSSVRKQILPKGKLIAIVAAVLFPFFINNLTDLYELSDKEWSDLSAIYGYIFEYKLNCRISEIPL